MQCVGLMREKMDPEMETVIGKCNSIAEVRASAENNPDIVSAVIDSVSHVKVLLAKITERLELKGKRFFPFNSASLFDIDSIWNELICFDINKDEKLVTKTLPSKPKLLQFLQHCCTLRHYVFQI